MGTVMAQQTLGQCAKTNETVRDVNGKIDLKNRGVGAVHSDDGVISSLINSYSCVYLA